MLELTMDRHITRKLQIGFKKLDEAKTRSTKICNLDYYAWPQTIGRDEDCKRLTVHCVFDNSYGDCVLFIDESAGQYHQVFVEGMKYIV